MQNIDFRTDLALERREIYLKKNQSKQIDGVISNEESINEKIKITNVKITNSNGEKTIGKPIGDYITIDIKKLKNFEQDDIETTSNILSEKLKLLIKKHVSNKDEILVVGLGNEYVTPDSLGPKVISGIDVTRHIIKYLPQYIDKDARSVSAVSPGVLGTTGIETLEILEGIISKTNPKLIIVIDALASRSIERISSSIQISDTRNCARSWDRQYKKRAF